MRLAAERILFLNEFNCVSDYLSLSLCVRLSFSLSICLSVCLSLSLFFSFFSFLSLPPSLSVTISVI